MAANNLEQVAPKLHARSRVAIPKPHASSSITNGTKLLPNADGRSTWIRRAKDLIARHLMDLTAGDADAVSEAQRSIIRRAATLTIELERLEEAFALAGDVQSQMLDTYQRCANSLRRLLESVGLERRARDVSPPTLAEIAAEIAAENEIGE